MTNHQCYRHNIGSSTQNTKRMDQWHEKNLRSGIIKGDEAPTKRHSRRTTQILEKILKREL